MSHLKKKSDGGIKVVATSVYAGSTRSISAYLKKDSSFYFNSVFTSTGISPTINQLNSMNGELYLTNPNEWKLPDNIHVNGTIKNTGPIFIQGSQHTADSGSEIMSKTRISLKNTPALATDLYSKEIILDNVTHVYGDVYVTTHLSLNTACVFHGNIYLGASGTISNENNVNFSDPSFKVRQWFNAEAELDKDFIYANNLNDSQYPLVTKPPVGVILNQMNSPAESLTINSNITFQSDNNKKYDLNIYTPTDKDIFIHVKGDRFTTKNIKIHGDGHVFIYVDGEYYGGGEQGINQDNRVYNDDAPPQLYIISTTGKDVNLRDNECTKFNGYIYAPKSKATLPKDNTIYVGSVIANSFNDINKLTITYISPPENIADTIGIPVLQNTSVNYSLLGFTN